MQFLADELGHLVLTKARLRMLQNGLRDPHNVLAAPVDLRLHLGFEFFYSWPGNSCGCNVDAVDGPIVAEAWRKASVRRRTNVLLPDYLSQDCLKHWAHIGQRQP